MDFLKNLKHLQMCTYFRMNYSLISGLSEGEHTTIIKVLPKKLDK